MSAARRIRQQQQQQHQQHQPMLLVCTVDGWLQAIDRQTGQLVWRSDPTIVKPLISQNSAIHQLIDDTLPDNNNEDNRNDNDADDDRSSSSSSSGNAKMSLLVEPGDESGGGRLYLVQPGEPLRRLPFSIRRLVQLSPFRANDGSIYIGHKSTSVLELDALTGRVRREFSSGDASPPSAAADNDGEDQQPSVVHIGRIEYHLAVYEGADNDHHAKWNLTYIEYDTADFAVRTSPTPGRTATGDDWDWDSSSPTDQHHQHQFLLIPSVDGKLKRFDILPGATADYFGDDSHLLLRWSHRFPSAVVSVFDLLPPQGPLVDKDAAIPEWTLFRRSFPVRKRPESLDAGSSSSSSGDRLDQLQFHIGLTSAGRTPFVLSGQRYLTQLNEHQRPSSSDFNGGEELISASKVGEGSHLLATIQQDCWPGSPRFPVCLTGVYRGEIVVASAAGYGDQVNADLPLLTIDPPPLEQQPSASLEPTNISGWKLVSGSLEFSLNALLILLLSAGILLWQQLRRWRMAGSSAAVSASRKQRRRKQQRAADVPTTAPITTTVNSGASGDPALTMVGDLVVNEQKILGYGSHGTVVYRGQFQGRPVAVKRLLLDFFDVADQEVELLMQSDHHTNVIRYYCKQQTDRFMYIALELCLGSLQDLVESGTPALSSISNNNNNNNDDDDDDFQNAIAMQIAQQQLKDSQQTMLQEVALGLQHLHHLKIVHRDIKPQNILIAHLAKNSNSLTKYRLLISDFGLCKKLADDQSSFYHTARFNGGTMGWRAPETIRALPPADSATQLHMQVLGDSLDSSRGDESSSNPTGDENNSSSDSQRITKAVDIFSTGLVFYYILTAGRHPYGDRLVRELNILADKKDLSALAVTSSTNSGGEEAVHLIRQMLSWDPRQRPSAGKALAHPFFWPPARRLQFLLDVSDRLDVEDRQSSYILAYLESKDIAGQVLPADGWQRKVDRLLYENLGKYRKYSAHSLQDLLRALRNKKNHYHDLPDELKTVLGSVPAGFLEYFTSRFPRLLIFIYDFVCLYMRDDSMFEQYLLN